MTFPLSEIDMSTEDIITYFSDERESHREVHPIKNPCTWWYTGIMFVTYCILFGLSIAIQLIIVIEYNTLDITIMISLIFYIIEFCGYLGVPLSRCFVVCAACLCDNRFIWFLIFHGSRYAQFALIILHVVVFPWGSMNYSIVISLLYSITGLTTIATIIASFVYLAVTLCTTNSLRSERRSNSQNI